jgi:hypothetical protein
MNQFMANEASEPQGVSAKNVLANVDGPWKRHCSYISLPRSDHPTRRRLECDLVDVANANLAGQFSRIDAT